MLKQQKMTVSKTEQKTFSTSESVVMEGQTVVRRTVQTYTTSGNSANGGKTVTTIHTTRDLTPEEFEKLSLTSGLEDGVKITEVKKTTEENPESKSKGLFSGFKKPAIFQKTKEKSVTSPDKENSGKARETKMGGCSGKTVGSSAHSNGKFEQECLSVHNQYRAKHGVPPLKLSKELCAFAQEWADNIAKTGRSMHRPNNKYGENIFMKWSSDPNHHISGSDPVESWYSEIKDHTFGREPTSLKSGHFTQVIWKGSEELGVAQARSKNGTVYVVANYNPAGNMIGDFTANVPPPKS